MKAILSERNLVLVLFVMVFIIFSFAHEDSKKMENGYSGFNAYTARNISLQQETLNSSTLPDIDVQKTSGQN